MKKIFALIPVVLCLGLCAFFLWNQPSSAPELAPVETTLTTQAPVETTLTTQAPAETTPQTTAAPTQPGNIVEVSQPYFESGYETEDTALEVFDCRMFTLDNGCTRFEVDYQTVDGLQAIAFAYTDDDHSHRPAFWYEAETRTTQNRETLVFEMETEILSQSNGPDIHFQNRSYESVSYILIYPAGIE